MRLAGFRIQIEEPEEPSTLTKPLPARQIEVPQLQYEDQVVQVPVQKQAAAPRAHVRRRHYLHNNNADNHT